MTGPFLDLWSFDGQLDMEGSSEGIAIRAWQSCAGRLAPLYTKHREELWATEVKAFFFALLEGVAG